MCNIKWLIIYDHIFDILLMSFNLKFSKQKKKEYFYSEKIIIYDQAII
jgi:hypothetical protein